MATSKARKTLATSARQYNQLAESLSEKTVKKLRDKTTAKERLAALKAAAYNDTKGTFTGRTADFNIDPLPKDEHKAPKEGSLRARALAMMQNGDITLEGASDLCRAFDKERGKDTDEGTVNRRGYELIRLVAISNGYGAVRWSSGLLASPRSLACGGGAGCSRRPALLPPPA